MLLIKRPNDLMISILVQAVSTNGLKECVEERTGIDTSKFKFISPDNTIIYKDQCLPFNMEDGHLGLFRKAGIGQVTEIKSSPALQRE